MAAGLGPGSRAGSLSTEAPPPAAAVQPNSNGHGPGHDDNPLATLARRNTVRNRSLKSKKVVELQDVGSHHASMESLVDDARLAAPHNYQNGHHRRSPSLRRTPSPRRRVYYNAQHHDIGFSDTVSNVVEIVKHEHQRHHRSHRAPHHYYQHGGREWRPSHAHPTTSLSQPSRSPSPPHHTFAWTLWTGHERERYERDRDGDYRSWKREGARRGRGRQLPPTPSKPSTLQINQPYGGSGLPKLHNTPSHLTSRLAREPLEPQHDEFEYSREVERLIHRDYRSRERRGGANRYESERGGRYDGGGGAPLSFEAALALGRGGGVGSRVLPSPAPPATHAHLTVGVVPNGYKPRARHSDSDDDDWC